MVGAGALAGPAGAEPDGSAATGGRFALELDGAKAGAPAHGSGGHAVGIVAEDGSTPTTVSKHIAGVKYEDITVTCGAGMSKDFYNWIKASFDGKEPRHSGRLTSREADGTAVDAVSFENALISEVTFPALDASSKDAAKTGAQDHETWVILCQVHASNDHRSTSKSSICCTGLPSSRHSHAAVPMDSAVSTSSGRTR